MAKLFPVIFSLLSISNGQTISCGETVTGSLSAGGYQIYYFTPTSSNTFYTCGSVTNFDTKIEVVLEYPNTVVALNDDHHGNCTSIYSGSLSTDSYLTWTYSVPAYSVPYYVRVCGYDTSSYGDYSLTFVCSDDDVGIVTTAKTSNLQTVSPTPSPTAYTIVSSRTDNSYLYGQVITALVFAILGLLSLLDAKYCRKNDYFSLPAILTAALHVLDVYGDGWFVVSAAVDYAESDNTQFLVICLLSVVFILLPVISSLVQLHHASCKYWLFDTRIREWLLSYSQLLYFVSVVTGSSFAAIEIFNSNLFGLDVFYMGISRQYLLGFTAKQVYSMSMMEDIPQLILCTWSLVLKGRVDLIEVGNMIFSMISIVVTVVSMCLQKQIYKTQESAHVTIDVTGECVMKQFKICKNRISETHAFLYQSVLGIHEKSVEIQKPFVGDIRNGVRLHIHICYVCEESGVNPVVRYEDLLNASIDNGSLQKALKEEWELEDLPEIGNVSCRLSKYNLKANKTGKSDEGEATGESETNHYLPPNTVTATPTKLILFT
eukprot:CAMPEP_0197045832 /NCGR_PEP_ID=MMETSP1384-20130603/21612_1 /TAXON_ID=29189 /ORGANISM="Ammonia sp." /LENGTH=544 /DNA_ID=CAMNT_0042477501 /DNA_START=68 /DNA_END=1702 /DNA_ORIENTATION=-